MTTTIAVTPDDDATPTLRARTAAPAWGALLAGALLLPFTQAQTPIPIASWIAPLLLLRFARSGRPRAVLPVLALVLYLGTLVALRGTFAFVEVAVISLGSAVMLLPYLLDTVIGGRLGRGWRTLVFPLTDTAIGFLASGGAWATMGHVAYTQVAELPLLQVTAVTGIWGLGFLVMWAAPVGNDLWEHGWDLGRSHRAVRVFTAVIVVTALLGGARLAFAPPPAATVRVAALAPDRVLREAAFTADLTSRAAGPDERSRLTDRHLRPLLDDLLTRSREAARSGAELVVWSEAATLWFAEDESTLLEAVRDVADEEDVHLQIGTVLLLPDGSEVGNENRAILYGPDGRQLWDYPKTLVVGQDGNAPGPGVVPVVDTPFGRIATVICFDADLPSLVRQAGRADADIVLVPASDWSEIAELHARMVVPRAVENGVTVVRPTAKGTSLVVDDRGQVLASDRGYDVDDHHTLVADVPTRGTWTPYRVVGDLVGWFAVAGLGTVVVAAFVRRRRAGSATPPTATEAARSGTT